MWFWFSLIALICWSGSDLFSKIGCQDADDKYSHLKMVMAVGVVIGGAFNKIVSSLVNDVIMPLVSLLVGGLNVTDWKWVIREAVYAADGSVVTAETALCYGSFIQSVIDFLIIALTIFTVLRVFAKLQRKRKEEPAEETK